MRIEKQNARYLLLSEAGQVHQDEGHYVGVVVFEEAEVRILVGYLVGKEGELGYLEELIHSKLSI